MSERMNLINKENSEVMIQTPFIVNEELDAIIPKLVKEKFDALKADIKSNGLKMPLMVMPDKTIIDGHNRYKACKELGKKDYDIDFKVVPIVSIQEAKEISIEMNFFRRQMDTYVAATWALGVYGKEPDTVVGSKVALSNRTIGQVRKVNGILEVIQVTDKGKKFKTDLELGLISTSEVLSQLDCAANIDNIIAVVDTRVAPKIGKDKAKQFKAQLAVEYFEKKYDKKSLKAINTEIDRVENPELYAPIDDSDYFTAVNKVTPKINELKSNFPDDVKVYMVSTEEEFLATGQRIKDFAAEDKLYAIVCMLKLPKELIPDE